MKLYKGGIYVNIFKIGDSDFTMKEISIKKAALINGAANYSCVILQILFSAVLARLLTPEDYGIISVVTVFTTFLQYHENGGERFADEREKLCV